MNPAAPKRNPEEIAKLGNDIFERRVQPLLKPEDDGKYVAIDIATEEYVIDDNDYAALTRLTDRRRGAQVWIVRVGKPYRMSFRMRFGQ
ncbi:MAG: hypothetical protein L0241_05045 [Planctomycetia bacterium]|nr:hypothetical protein [Planctomycetia bacterium]